MENYYSLVGTSIARPLLQIVKKHIIMPNHIHMIIEINEKNYITLSKIIQQLKGIVTKKLGYSVWQRRFYDHIIRNEKEYNAIKQYIQNNVINWCDDKYFY